jgi:hypothetical protein
VGKIAPWAPWTRAGCNVGAFSTANIEFENIGADINNVYGPNSNPRAAHQGRRSQVQGRPMTAMGGCASFHAQDKGPE